MSEATKPLPAPVVTDQGLVDFNGVVFVPRFSGVVIKKLQECVATGEVCFSTADAAWASVQREHEQALDSAQAKLDQVREQRRQETGRRTT